ncbi:UNVERIFIED_CONTAM: hypothetical protein Slati_2713000, partial [Sesamum latifolium]
EGALVAFISGVVQVEELIRLSRDEHQMEANLENLTRTLVLTEDEEVGLDVVVQEGQVVGENQGSLLVGRLLTPKAFRYDVLKSTLNSVIRRSEAWMLGMLADHRFLLLFNHMADRERALRGSLWVFDRNLVILASIKDDENSMSVQLNWCPFFVHVHGLPLRLMMPEIAETIGNRMGQFMEYDNSNSWGASI